METDNKAEADKRSDEQYCVLAENGESNGSERSTESEFTYWH